MWIEIIYKYHEGFTFSARHYLDDYISVLLIIEDSPEKQFKIEKFIDRNEGVIEAAERYKEFQKSIKEHYQFEEE